MSQPNFTRRSVLLGGVTTAAGLVLAACTPRSAAPSFLSPSGDAVAQAEKARQATGKITRMSLTAGRTDFDLAGRPASTWAYNDRIPGPLLRATAGDTIHASVTNNLPDDTSVHWHGLALRNDMDGVPPVTQKHIASETGYEYEFVADAPGTYWLHPHVGPQLDRGLYAPLIIDDPNEPLAYDQEWVIVLDDWLDGVTTTPDEVLVELRQGMGGMGHMGGMGGSGSSDGGTPTRSGNTLLGATSDLLGGDAGDVFYPHYLINGRPVADPETFTTKPGQRIRLRIINAAGDTAFRFAVGGHALTVTHTDGYPVDPVEGESILIGMGERYDAIITTNDGAFPVVAEAEGKAARAFAVLRANATSPAPTADSQMQMAAPVTANQLNASSAVTLPDRAVDRRLELSLTGGMMSYDWGVDGRAFDMDNPLAGALSVQEGERVQLTIRNMTMMWHPFHLHGHTYEHEGSGPRKDTSIVLPMRSLTVLFDADNPGLWMAHCHNIYHAESGMMTVLGYERE